jgi:hypothetical protein
MAFALQHLTDNKSDFIHVAHKASPLFFLKPCMTPATGSFYLLKQPLRNDFRVLI